MFKTFSCLGIGRRPPHNILHVDGQWVVANPLVILAAFSLPVIAIVAALLLSVRRPARQELNYTQITNFTDSAVCPALSPDGRMLAFIRSEYTFGVPGSNPVSLPISRPGKR